MFALFELFLIAFKILLYASMYAILVLLAILLLLKATKASQHLIRHKARIWWSAFAIITVLMFSYKFSYWQDTGLGDNSRIPIGYGQAIESEDFQWTYFYPDPQKTMPNRDELVIGNYSVLRNFICAEVPHDFSNSPSYDFVVYDLRARRLTVFSNEQQYTAYAIANHLPLRVELYGFKQHYAEYLGRKSVMERWLLP